MKEEMLKYLEENYWTSGRDDDLIHEFINDFFDQYQPERTSEKDRKVCDVPNTPTKGSESTRNE